MKRDCVAPAMPWDDDEPMSPKDVGLELGCSARHAATLMRQSMPYYDIGLGTTERLRIKRRDFLVWLQERKSTTRQTDSASAVTSGGRGTLSRAKKSRRVAGTALPLASGSLNENERQLLRVSSPRNVRRSAG